MGHSYSLMDDSYSDTKSFGFWIDTGNGFITFIPTALFWVGMTYDIMDARLLGVMGLIFNYQMWYVRLCDGMALSIYSFHNAPA